ncbi:unnamed protein product [Lactuca saligna]|uniref:Uncharacterized protein n=1 Tax=Lactuca saligna TaxID=75948 RepID=A0AA36EG33_LACSI|nr:unnamed protein product [Lactuca saligna]
MNNPPNVPIPTLSSPLTKRNTFLLLDWLHNLRALGVSLPERKGVGATAPDMSEFETLEDGVVVPLGHPKKQQTSKDVLCCSCQFQFQQVTFHVVYWKWRNCARCRVPWHIEGGKLRPRLKYRELQEGISVKSGLKDIMVHPDDVLGPSVPGPIFLLVDCPTLSHISWSRAHYCRAGHQMTYFDSNDTGYTTIGIVEELRMRTKVPSTSLKVCTPEQILEDFFPLHLDYYDRSKASTSIQEVVLPFVLIGLADINKAKSITVKEVNRRYKRLEIDLDGVSYILTFDHIHSFVHHYTSYLISSLMFFLKLRK